MFSLLKKRNAEIEDIYNIILDQSHDPKLYTDYKVPDKPIGRFQMITLHAAPYFIEFHKNNETEKSQILFDLIFQDIEYSFREIGVGDLSVPKKMKRYMKDFNGIIQAHTVSNADHIDITRRNIFGNDGECNSEFKNYIKGLF